MSKNSKKGNERESQGNSPKESREKSAGKESVADILTSLDDKMKERQRQQQLKQK
jgi:hypothetical protein